MRGADGPDAQRTAHDTSDAPPAPSLPDLLSGTSLVALVPATADLEAAALMAWRVARGAAAAGRKVALVDCHVDEPQLHAATGEENPDGIVDVFEYGVSLSRIAQQQPEPNLYFVPAGTFAPDPAVMAAHPRWRRLSAGFRHEDAVMLLFLPADAIASLSGVLDGIVVLAPDGAEAGFASTPELGAAAEAGVRLLATIVESDGPEAVAAPAELAPQEETPPAEPERAVAFARPARLRTSEEYVEPAFLRRLYPEPARPGVRVAVYGFVALLAALVLVASYGPRLGIGDLGLGLSWAAAADSLMPMRIVPGYRGLAPHAVDTLPFAVRVSAWTSLPFALDAAAALEGRGIPQIVSPVRLGQRLWYRVYAGPVATRDAADSLLGAVRGAGLDRPGTAAAVLAPLSLALRRFASAAAARTARVRLQAAGIPSFILGQADGTYRVYAGAFAMAEQAAYLDSLVTSTGSAGQLGPRVGFHP